MKTSNDHLSIQIELMVYKVVPTNLKRSINAENLFPCSLQNLESTTVKKDNIKWTQTLNNDSLLPRSQKFDATNSIPLCLVLKFECCLVWYCDFITKQSSTQIWVLNKVPKYGTAQSQLAHACMDKCEVTNAGSCNVQACYGQ